MMRSLLLKKTFSFKILDFKNVWPSKTTFFLRENPLGKKKGCLIRAES
jgi:hypothetical protein